MKLKKVLSRKLGARRKVKSSRKILGEDFWEYAKEFSRQDRQEVKTRFPWK